MYFNKIPPAANFQNQPAEAPEKQRTSTLTTLGEGLFRYTIRAPQWQQKSQANLDEDIFKPDSCGARITADSKSGLLLKLNNQTLLRSFAGREFGILGQKWAMSFEYNTSMRFYGLGEKNDRLEKTGGIYKFWNTDTIGDFGTTRVRTEPTDPMYVSIPYVLITQESGCVGILINNPHATFMNLAAKENIANLLDAKDNEQQTIHIGAYDGTPDIYFIIGDSPRSVTRKLQRLCGTTPLPPLWSLGYQQCRWGYRDLDDLEALDRKFDELEIPCDGLWLDIDYMDAYKVFTVVDDGFKGHRARIQALKANGRRIIPIIDPGVKYCTGYSTFEDGRNKDIFCKTAEGGIYSGFVWPGRTAFPDYSQEKARTWWAEQLQNYTLDYLFDGYWLDMNDPSTGSAELEDMRFNNGQDDHSSFHNQYAYGMQQASRRGLTAAIGQKRPFILSRSGFISSSRYSAIWTGDNWSNYFHLKASINMSLNLSLSGLPFNGPDVPGFEGDATPELAVDWFKAGFLFPFFRNHSAANTRQQEPWAFEDPYRQVIIHYIRLRYKLLPYLYNLFICHTESGDPILRPLFYEFTDTAGRLDTIEDQFMIGPSIMQAPIVNENESERSIALPTCNWFDAGSGQWIENKRQIQAITNIESTPLFIRDGAILAMRPGELTKQCSDLSNIECHIFISEHNTKTVTWDYRFDDGETINAPQAHVRLQFSQQGDNTLHVNCQQLSLGAQDLHIHFVTYHNYHSICLQHKDDIISIPSKEHSLNLTGQKLAAYRSPSYTLTATSIQPRPDQAIAFTN
ncbi:glycoside hydrolase family 31 protein [Coraliomargarita sp. SDUM461004]|uniref:Glycoside hydrolase family 31 protein n=1 Tax=Thalassobacterium sedimentorum TaxID=3041258 RepID=A0ABU1AJX8_9BACT|nr:glycoside hydrolase family 31 protein [Coraliomargarita sp. SDUM461004]MDQ8193913.1 glycoside hydrolase family 31 protein [Coraliomargarita sp. SDUM461004]